jgi:DNA-nicking Smr family endonuclease
MSEPHEEAVIIPIDGVLDLHAFSPKDAASVVEEYIGACIEQGLNEIRIIHGKGKGALRRTVHALLERHPDVLEYRLDSGPSGWGATVVCLRGNEGVWQVTD